MRVSGKCVIEKMEFARQRDSAGARLLVCLGDGSRIECFSCDPQIVGWLDQRRPGDEIEIVGRLRTYSWISSLGEQKEKIAIEIEQVCEKST